MKKNRRKVPDQSSSFTFFWAPPVVLLGVGLFVIIRSFAVHNYVNGANIAQNDALNGLSWVCFLLAAALALTPSFRTITVAHLDRLSSAPPRRHALWIAAAYGGIWVWLGFIRYCEYRGFLLGQDTAVSVNEAHNFIHYGKLYMSIFGVNPLSIHFNFLRQMLSPALLLWNHPLSPIFLEDAFLFSAPIAVYCLTFNLTRSSLAGFCGFLLTLSTPYFHELLASNLCVSAAAVLFPWAMFFFDKTLWWPAGLLLLAMVGSTEAMPLTFFGLGLYCIFASGWDKLRGWRIGLAVCGISAAWWFADMAAIHHFTRASATDFSGGYWGMFRDLVPTGTPLARIPSELASHPIRDIILIFSSRFRFYHALRVLFYMGFLCLAAPAATLPFLASVFPYILAAPATSLSAPFLEYKPYFGYYDFYLHEGVFMFAPLLWATAMGIKRIHDRLLPRGWQSWLLVWVLLIGGFGFKYARRTPISDWRSSWFDAMPRAMAKIPPKARLWVDAYASSLVSNRRWIKITEWGPGWPSGFEINLFKPDYVLLDKRFIKSALLPYRDQMLTYFGQNGYRKIVDDTDVILLESPNPSTSPEDVPTEWVTMPPPNSEIAEAYAQYLLPEPKSTEFAHDNPGSQSKLDSAESDNSLGLALVAQDKLDEAILRFESALRARPDYAGAHNNLGVVLTRQNKLDEAIRHFELALRTRPDYAEAQSNLGAILVRQGKWAAAIPHFRRSLQIDPSSSSTRSNLEFALKMLEQTRSAGR